MLPKSLTFERYISHLLRDDWFVNVDPVLAKEIAEIDKREEHVHVQFEHHEMEEWMAGFKTVKLNSPRVWSKRWWMENNQNWIRLKAESADRRRLYFLEKENIEVITYRLARKFGLPKATTLLLATKLVTEKNMAGLTGLGVNEDISFE